MLLPAAVTGPLLPATALAGPRQVYRVLAAATALAGLPRQTGRRLPPPPAGA